MNYLTHVKHKYRIEAGPVVDIKTGKEKSNTGKIVREFEYGNIVKVEHGYLVSMVDLYSGEEYGTLPGKGKPPFPSKKLAEEEYYIQIAWDHKGSAIRDNSRADKIRFGKDIEEGKDDDADE